MLYIFRYHIVTVSQYVVEIAGTRFRFA